MNASLNSLSLELTPLETVSHKALLGIRFWDTATDSQIAEGLLVTLYSEDNSRRKIHARKTRSGVYGFFNIPGMFIQETQDQDDLSSPVPIKTFVVEVQDLQQRYTPAAFSVDLPLPYNGIFLVDDDTGSPANSPKGFNLYSSVTRKPAAQFTFLRGDLVDRNTGEAAAHALVRVENDDGFSWYSVADENGKFAVMLPYPLLNISFGSSPPTSDGVRLFERTWTVNVTVMYEPLSLDELPGTDLPDYSSILSQGQALLYMESPQTDVGEVNELQAELVYGRDLVIKTAGYSELYISATGSPA